MTERDAGDRLVAADSLTFAELHPREPHRRRPQRISRHPLRAPPARSASAGPRCAHTPTSPLQTPQNPSSTTHHTQSAAPHAMPPPPPRLLLCLSYSLPTDPFKSPPLPVLLTTAPHPTRPSTNSFLCRALTPPEHLYGGWAGSGPGTDRNPRVHRGSGVDTTSIAGSIARSAPLTAPFRPRNQRSGRVAPPR